ncbi:hypothetical protein AB1Y20_003896 [Prymnesium parvum]|uniref:Rab3 GTPase-activating protein catalytic subunit n=1 Tax=Prymnesium parvum TaxID=97485 RepID=A0AB34J6H0_PRYPA
MPSRPRTQSAEPPSSLLTPVGMPPIVCNKPSRHTPRQLPPPIVGHTRTDVSFLADQRRRSAAASPRPPAAATAGEWRAFKASLAPRRVTTVRPSPLAPPRPLPPPLPLRARWAHGTCRSIAGLLFPDDAVSVSRSLSHAARHPSPPQPPPPPHPPPHPSPRAARAPRPAAVALPSDSVGMPRVHFLPAAPPPSAAWAPPLLPAAHQLLEVAASGEPSGRQAAVRLAAHLSQTAGPAPPAAGEPLAAGKTDDRSVLRLLSRANEPAIHEPYVWQALLSLTSDELIPSFEPVNAGMHELARMSAAHCVEEGMLIEYMRRHFAGAVHLSRALLGVVHSTLTMYDQLCEVTDQQLLHRFQESLGDALKVLAPELCPSPPANRPTEGSLSNLTPVDTRRRRSMPATCSRECSHNWEALGRDVGGEAPGKSEGTRDEELSGVVADASVSQVMATCA